MTTLGHGHGGDHAYVQAGEQEPRTDSLTLAHGHGGDHAYVTASAHTAGAVRVPWGFHREYPETWGEDYHQYASENPHAAAIGQAQDHLRMHVPAYETALPDSEREAGQSLQSMLRRGGHPRADEAFVVRHRDDRRGTSNVVYDPDDPSIPGAALHSSRWDYGTLAHEAAHILHHHEIGRKPNEATADEVMHGPDFVRHFKATLTGVHKRAPEELEQAYGTALERIQRATGQQRTAAAKNQPVCPSCRDWVSYAVPGGWEHVDGTPMCSSQHAAVLADAEAYAQFSEHLASQFHDVAELPDEHLDEHQRRALDRLKGEPELIRDTRLHKLMQEYGIQRHRSSPEDRDPDAHTDLMWPRGRQRFLDADEPLHTSQSYLHRPTLERLIRSPMLMVDPKDDFGPRVYQEDGPEGRHWLQEGHHRTMADRMTQRSGVMYDLRETNKQRAAREARERARQAVKRTAAIRMIEPGDLKSFHFPDYPNARTPAALVKHFKKTSPDYYEKVKEDVQKNGFTTPVLVKWNDHRGKPLKKPHLMEGHHRAAVAHELGIPLPVGDYDDMGDYEHSFKAGQEWWKNNQRPTDDMPRLSRLAFLPTKRLFGPTYGLDTRLFDGEHLKPDVRRYILETLADFWKPKHGVAWDEWAIVYLAGSEASEWTSEERIGNNDFDVLVGVDYTEYRRNRSRTDPAQQMTDQEITDELNADFKLLNQKTAQVYIPIEGKLEGPFSNTWYVNPDSYDIRRIKPYAAYDVTHDEWAVKPPHLPAWDISQFPEGPALVAECKAVSAYVRAILNMPEPYRTQQGYALWHHLHSDRARAFSDQGEGWYDPGNVIEKWLDQEGLWEKLVQIMVRVKNDPSTMSAPADWSNDPTRAR